MLPAAGPHAACVSPADEGCSSSKQLCGGNQAATEKMIQFGRELQTLSEQLCREFGTNTTHKKMLQVRRDGFFCWVSLSQICPRN